MPKKMLQQSLYNILPTHPFVTILLRNVIFFAFPMVKNATKEASVAQWLSHSPCRPGVADLIPGFSSPLDKTLNGGPMDKLLTRKYCDEAGDHYAVMTCGMC